MMAFGSTPRGEDWKVSGPTFYCGAVFERLTGAVCRLSYDQETMRITGDVETINRLCASLNMQAKGKSVSAQLSVGKKPTLAGTEAETLLMITTKQNRSGIKYKLRNNVEQIFAKFITKGMVTLRFTQPPVDIAIKKADPVQLKAFLSVVKLSHSGSPLDKVSLSSLSPATANTMENLKRKLTITSRKDYPITTNFPHGLNSLSVHHCSLKRVDSRMLRLRHLQVLSLNNNCIQSLPDDWSSMPSLTELSLVGNQLTDIPHGLCSGLSGTLKLLDMESNKLRLLRPYICELISLVTLKLSDNELVCLPTMMSRMASLQFLHVANNQLRVLPASFSQLRLERLDLHSNSFLDDGPSTIINRLRDDVGLLELCARAIKKHRVCYQEEDLPRNLYDILAAPKWCLCGSACFLSFVHYLARLDLRHVSRESAAIDMSGRMHAPAEAFLCSQKCFDRYKKNPRATLWRN